VSATWKAVFVAELLFSFEGNYILHVVSMREHVYRAYGCYFIVLTEDFQVACL
jgi:hypothetical protein